MTWAAVDTDKYGQMTCPVFACAAPLYLTRAYCIPLFAQGGDHETKDAVSDGWEVECTNGHKLRDNTDQARETDDADETADSALPYDHRATHRAIARLAGESS